MKEYIQEEFDLTGATGTPDLDAIIIAKIEAHKKKWPRFKAERFAEWLCLRMTESETGEVPRFTKEFVANADIRNLTRFAARERNLYSSAINGYF